MMPVVTTVFVHVSANVTGLDIDVCIWVFLGVFVLKNMVFHRIFGGNSGRCQSAAE